MTDIVEKVEEFIELNKLDTVYIMLDSLMQEQPENGETNYCCGRYYMVCEDWEEALKYLNNALKLGYVNEYVYGEIATAQRNLGNVNYAEQAYYKMLDYATEDSQRWGILSVIASLYEEHHMYLKMEKIAKQLITYFPDNIQGYHIRYIAQIERKRLNEAEMILENLPQGLKCLPQFVIDYTELLEKQGEIQKMMQFLDEQEEFKLKYKNYYLKKKILFYSQIEEYEKAEDTLKRLATEQGDIDAIQGLMILYFSKQEYRKSMALGNLILEQETDNKAIYHYLVKVYRLFSIYLLKNKNPNEETKKWMSQEIDEILDFYEEYSINPEEIVEQLQSLKEAI